MPKTAIVVPARDSHRFLAETLQSIAGQTDPNWQCIVVDDGSQDETPIIAELFASRDTRFTLIQQPARGTSSARNTGYRAISSDVQFVTFMDSDDVWLPDTLTRLRARLESNPLAVGAHGLAEFIDENNRLDTTGTYATRGRSRLGVHNRRLIEWPLDWPTDFRVLVNGNVLFPPGLLLSRRSTYDAAGPFDEQFSGGEDWDMLIRLSRFGHLEFINEVMLYYRRHSANAGARPTTPRQAWLVRCKAFYSPENTVTHQRLARSGWRAYQRRMVSEAWQQARQGFAAGELQPTARQLLRLMVSAIRYVRGYPLPRVSSQRLTW